MLTEKERRSYRRALRNYRPGASSCCPGGSSKKCETQKKPQVRGRDIKPSRLELQSSYPGLHMAKVSIKKDGQGGRAVSQPDRETRQSFFSRDFTVTWTGEKLGRWEIFAKSSSGFRVSRPLLKSPQSEGGLLWTFLLHLGGGEGDTSGFSIKGSGKKWG